MEGYGTATAARNKAKAQPRIVAPSVDESANGGPDEGRGDIELFGPDPLGERLRAITGKLLEELVNEEIEEIRRARR